MTFCSFLNHKYCLLWTQMMKVIDSSFHQFVFPSSVKITEIKVLLRVQQNLFVYTLWIVSL